MKKITNKNIKIVEVCVGGKPIWWLGEGFTESEIEYLKRYLDAAATKEYFGIEYRLIPKKNKISIFYCQDLTPEKFIEEVTKVTINDNEVDEGKVNQDKTYYDFVLQHGEKVVLGFSLNYPFEPDTLVEIGEKLIEQYRNKIAETNILLKLLKGVGSDKKAEATFFEYPLSEKVIRIYKSYFSEAADNFRLDKLSPEEVKKLYKAIEFRFAKGAELKINDTSLNYMPPIGSPEFKLEEALEEIKTSSNFIQINHNKFGAEESEISLSASISKCNFNIVKGFSNQEEDELLEYVTFLVAQKFIELLKKMFN